MKLLLRASAAEILREESFSNILATQKQREREREGIMFKTS